ncbi:hypothetical protein [Methanogenium cariaci]|nr:hypothetical protein [Methanogenium cariaci]
MIKLRHDIPPNVDLPRCERIGLDERLSPPSLSLSDYTGEAHLILRI